MAAIPYMPLYVADYLADAAHLSAVEHGAYLLLIMTYWQTGKALPNDDKKLARICRLGPREWERIKPVISEFFQIDCSGWSHRRVESELAIVRAKSLKKREGGLARAKQMHSNRLAPAQQSDTDTDIPLAKANGRNAAENRNQEALFPDLEKPSEPADAKPDKPQTTDADRLFWANAKAYLGSFGKGDPGAIIGKWVREHGKSQTAAAITASQVERAVDPIPYITRCLIAKKTEPQEPQSSTAWPC